MCILDLIFYLVTLLVKVTIEYVEKRMKFSFPCVGFKYKKKIITDLWANHLKTVAGVCNVKEL